jgi:hypothetical protein
MEGGDRTKAAETITRISTSPHKSKRYRVILADGRHFDFGLKNGSTYLDHRDKKKRYNYWARHYPVEHHLIDNLISSPALYSAMLLWGPSTSLIKNIKHLNSLLI